jgi:hypothetical protein
LSDGTGHCVVVTNEDAFSAISKHFKQTLQYENSLGQVAEPKLMLRTLDCNLLAFPACHASNYMKSDTLKSKVFDHKITFIVLYVTAINLQDICQEPFCSGDRSCDVDVA